MFVSGKSYVSNLVLRIGLIPGINQSRIVPDFLLRWIHGILCHRNLTSETSLCLHQRKQMAEQNLKRHRVLTANTLSDPKFIPLCTLFLNPEISNAVGPGRPFQRAHIKHDTADLARQGICTGGP